MTDAERDLIVKHSFESAANRRSALLVGFALQDIQRELITWTLNGVANRLKELAGDKWEVISKNVSPQECYLRLRGRNWPEWL
ncbi:MAG: hypothetical protein JNL98_36345 [Bryobacterales bacterium]|nr:hypothetical protein [Bryobacterales bacterium]